MSFSRNNKKKRYEDIAPEEIFLDAENHPGFDMHQLEGRLEQPIAWRVVLGVFGVFVFAALVFAGRLWALQIIDGEAYLVRSENNRLDRDIVFAKRGLIVDRNGRELASNIVESDLADFPRRAYATTTGLAHVLGYVSYPQKDAAGFYFRTEVEGKDGVEGFYDTLLGGENGSKISETNAVGEVFSESVIEPPEDGETLHLSVDADIQGKLYEFMEALARDVGFEGGAGVILDVTNGEILALTNYPEYSPELLANGADAAAIRALTENPQKPFLSRAVSGLYTPGSVIKPFIAAGALDRGIIAPEKEILSTGALSVPNPFNPTRPTIFKDWKAHGLVDMRRALAVSSNVYFFQIGGGFENQQGIGISGIEKYVRLFGIGSPTGIDLPGEVRGTIPSPAWKKELFPDDPWRIGDTYNTAIGQYGFQVTPLQLVRAVAAIANGGLLVEPHVRRDAGAAPVGTVPVLNDTFKVIREGMRLAVREGTAQGLNMSTVEIAAKTGTAELGAVKEDVNSWVMGFFPYDEPRYAFATVMEQGPATNVIGALYVMRQLFDWMSVHTPEYLE
jgi:penicillin-binding protein 2